MRALLKLLSDLPEEEAKPLISAYCTILRTLGLVDRDDPLTELIAKHVAECARSGVSDPTAVSEKVLQQFAQL